MKDWLKRFLAGIAIGAGSAVPGVSGGTIAVLFKVYEKLMWAISHLIKEFKRAFIYLLPMVIGIVIGIIPMMVVMNYALEGFTFGIICLFAGYIIGSLPLLKEEVKQEKATRWDIIFMVLAGLFALTLGVLSCFVSGNVSSFFNNTPIWFYFVLIPVGALASIALAVPGISGGMILIILGFYRPLIDSTIDTAKDCLKGNWTNFGPQVLLLFTFFVGVVIGFFLTSRFMHFLLSKYRKTTFYAIIGFVIGGLLALFMNYEIYSYYLMWANGGHGFLIKEIEIPLGVLLLIVACLLSYLLSKKQIKSNNEKESNAD